MKRFISIFTSIIMALTVICTGSISAFAESTTKYWEPRPNCQDTLSCINNEPGDGIHIDYNKSEGTHTISYDGEGTLTSWEFPTSKENVDYQIISQKGNSITIKLIDENYELPYVNALVDFGETTASAPSDTAQSNTAVQANPSTTTEKATTETAKQSTSVTAKEAAADINQENYSNNKIIVPYAVTGVIIVITVIGIILIKKHRA